MHDRVSEPKGENRMNRVCFRLQVRADRLEEYRALHRDVWPEMLEALSRSGWRNYSLFLQPDGVLIGYFETPGTFQDALDAMATEPINAKWQDMMAPFFEGTGNRADEQMVALEEVFHLP